MISLKKKAKNVLTVWLIAVLPISLWLLGYVPDMIYIVYLSALTIFSWPACKKQMTHCKPLDEWEAAMNGTN